MLTKAQKKKKELVINKAKSVIKLISAIVLIFLGVLYWYNHSQPSPTEEEKKYETGKTEEHVKKTETVKNEETVRPSEAARNAEPVTQTEKVSTVPAPAVTDVPVMYDEQGRLNINAAGIEELCKLNGIGEKRAKDIIDYRNANGYFKAAEDIMKVKGIKQGIFSKIKEYIFCG